ncbi:3'-5' exonuclease [Paenibacillus agricola]|uniref:Exonuclease domain-containing protein n=1 Tax=Paenibacillus agricola TaxID=2716264 RepID=A0ABX0J5R4_9BACL|nr:3'-5' exonuclease [Paenibacillus agricola]NHN30499.1 exonuclease domain-containing protein [Paenibacillus agricola]
MKLIIHDLETIKAGRRQNGECIQIGAVKVLLENDQFQVVDTFDSYIKPRSPLDASTTKFTGITIAQVERAESFPTVKDLFLDWIGEGEYYLLSWSLSDRDIFLDDCRRHKLETNWLKNYNDIQKMFMLRFGLERSISLVAALKQLEIEPVEALHNGLTDALLTYQILLKIFQPNNPIFTMNKNEFVEGYVEEIVLHEDFKTNPFAKLGNLFGN